MYLKPTNDQLNQMELVRESFRDFAKVLDAELPDGPDKTWIMRELRTVAMWANVTLTRNADGSPRS